MNLGSQQGLLWKANWPETKQRAKAWWAGTGLLVGTWFPPLAQNPRDGVNAPWPEHPATRTERACDARYRAELSRAIVSRQWLGLDCLPVADASLGPGSLATMLGSEPEFGEHTTWFHPCWREVEEPEKLPPISLNPANRWYVRQFELLRESRWLAGDDYAVGSPDLVEGLDVLASLRGTEGVLLDMVERPAWVQEKVMEINRARIAAFDACHTFCCTADNWTFHTSFKLVGPGKTDKLQCDLSAMFGPAMFQEFCVPHLTEQCRLCDHTMFHLDGSQCLCHLDLLLGIEDLGAIEWSPDPQVPSCADRRWWDMYRRIRAAGKSVQAINLQVHEVAPLLDGAGPEGMYLLVDVKDWREAEELEKVVARYATQ